MRYQPLLCLVLGACLLLPASADPERGKVIYDQLCFTCHGPHLDGGIGPVLNDAYWRHGSSPQAILEVINKGIPNTEMIGYEAVYPEADRLALRDFILSKQEGLREMVRAVYPNDQFAGKRLKPALFDAVESLSQTLIPENHFYFDPNTAGILRGTAKLHVKTPGEYKTVIRLIGRTSVYINGEEVHYSDEKTDKSTHFTKGITLAKGVHDFEVLHEEKPSHSYRFYGYIQAPDNTRFALTGRSLEGNVPKVIKAQPAAQVVRKWIKDLPPRTLLCLLPNQVIVAYNPTDGQVLQAWHSASVNQTPSLADRSARPSEITGTLIDTTPAQVVDAETLRFLYYEMEGDSVRIVSKIDGKEHALTIRPEGAQSYSLSLK